jgi:hypothetical protein
MTAGNNGKEPRHDAHGNATDGKHGRRHHGCNGCSGSTISFAISKTWQAGIDSGQMRAAQAALKTIPPEMMEVRPFPPSLCCISV